MTNTLIAIARAAQDAMPAYHLNSRITYGELGITLMINLITLTIIVLFTMWISLKLGDNHVG